VRALSRPPAHCSASARAVLLPFPRPCAQWPPLARRPTAAAVETGAVAESALVSQMVLERLDWEKPSRLVGRGRHDQLFSI
jgi:hypothetical protein